MLRFLIVDNNIRILDILEKALVKDFRAEVFKANSSALMIDLYKNQEFDLVIARNVIENEEGFKDELCRNLLAYFYDEGIHQNEVKLIAIGPVETAVKNFEELPDRFRIEELNRFVIKLTGITKDELQVIKKPDYTPFPLRDFFLFKKCPCDFYIKMARKEGPHFLKRMKRGDETDRQTVLRYLDSGLESFYIRREDWDDLMNGIFIALSDLIYEDKVSFDEWILKASDLYFLSKDLIFCTDEVSAAAKDLTKEFINANKKAIFSETHVYPLIEKTFLAEIPLESKFFTLQIILYFHLLGELDFGHKMKNEKGLEQIIFLCFFKDIYLRDEIEYLIHTKDKQIKMADKLSQEQIARIDSHAMMASNLVQKFSQVPSGTDVIIRQHHGMTNGVGLTDQLTVAISPQAMQLMIVEEFVLLLLGLDETNLSKELLKELAEQLNERFTTASYRKIVQAFSKLF